MDKNNIIELQLQCNKLKTENEYQQICIDELMKEKQRLEYEVKKWHHAYTEKLKYIYIIVIFVIVVILKLLMRL